MEKNMLQSQRATKILDYIECSFKISYLLLAIATFNSFVFGKPIMSILVMITFGLGGVLMIERLIHWKEYIGMPYLLLLLLFCLSFSISMVINKEFGFIENAKWLVWTSFQMFLLYVKRKDDSTEKYHKEFKMISLIIIWYGFFASVASIVLMLMRYSKITILETNGQRIIQGFIWGRLWGVYTDPNYGAVIGVISIILSLYFMQKQSRKICAMYIANIVMQFLYIVFSDSRTGKVTLLITIGFYLYTLLLKKGNEKKKIKKRMTDFVIVLFASILIIAGMKLVRVSYNNVISPFMSKMFFSEKQVTEEEKLEEDRIGREEDIKADPSNRRFSIWESGMEVLKTTPVFGTGYVTFVPYTEKNLPNTYVVNNDHGVFGSMHNGFLNVLVYQGIIGFIIFIAFTICAVRRVFKKIWKLQGKDYRFGVTMLSCIAAVVCSMMFLLEGTYTNSIGCIVLWCYLGWLIKLIDNKTMEKN